MIIADNIVIQKAHQMSCWHDTLDNVEHSGCLGEFRGEDVRCGIGSSGFQNIGNVLFRSLVNLNKVRPSSTAWAIGIVSNGKQKPPSKIRELLFIAYYVASVSNVQGFHVQEADSFFHSCGNQVSKSSWKISGEKSFLWNVVRRR